MRPDTDDLCAFLAGFTAAEGCFTGDRDHRFRYAVALGAADRAMCETLYDSLEVGVLYSSPRRRPHYDDESSFAVQALGELVEVVVPFMDEHLPVSHKREQYLEWRTRLLDYWETRAKRRRTCTVGGCEAPHRAHGLCRRHLYEQRGI